ncbi:MAG TPA: DsbE family thiol:disulfide interchange protein [Rhizomicrobium sp.]|jgi:cytochrome c biogenesis protein CcmG/thiol:disulfide interchange protein DsbE
MNWRRLVYVLPAALFAVLAYAMYLSLSAPAPGELPSVLVDKPAPAIALPALDAKAQGFGRADLAQGHVVVLNVFASWCVPCRAEAPALDQLKAMHGVALYGLVWKDSAAKARAFLDEVGNPYARIDLDEDGHAGIDWGVYGVPETFIIDGHGVVRMRYAGPLVGDALTKVVLPAIAEAQKG